MVRYNPYGRPHVHPHYPDRDAQYDRISLEMSSNDDAIVAATFIEVDDEYVVSPVNDTPEQFQDAQGRVPTGSTIPDPSSVEDTGTGRLYHGYRDGKYLLPNDGQEQDRLDLQHIIWTQIMGGDLAWAPLDQPTRALDIGTGTGIWALEFAEQNPSCQVIGTDLSAIQASRGLSNCQFVQEDTEDEWTIGENFDYIHLRMMVSCYADPRGVIQKLFTKVKPGGWVEYQDISFNVDDVDSSLQTKGASIRRWAHLCIAGAAVMGRNWESSKKYKEWMIEAGFVDVVERVLRCPGSAWPEDRTNKEIGRIMGVNCAEGLEPVALKVMKNGLGLPLEYVRMVIDTAAKDCQRKDIRYFWPFYVVYGRRPHDWEVNPPESQNVKTEPSPTTVGTVGADSIDKLNAE